MRKLFRKSARENLIEVRTFIERHAQRQLAKITQPHQDRIITTIYSLAHDPRPTGAKKLSGRGAWRLRSGDYRIIYEIQEGRLTVLVIAVGHRSKIYRDSILKK